MASVGEIEFRTTGTNSVTIYVSIPAGPVRRKVKAIEGLEGHPEQVHSGKAHKWHEMDHYGQYGTGYAQCRCGAIGVPYHHSDLFVSRLSVRLADCAHAASQNYGP